MQRLSAWLTLALLTIGFVLPAVAGVGDNCTPVAVPEIDPSIAQSALTLLVGGVLVLLGRVRSQQE